MSDFQIVALAILILGIGAVAVSITQVMLLSHGKDVEIGFGEIKEGWRNKKYAALAPILLGVIGVFVTIYAIALVMYAFQSPLLVTLIWLVACLYASYQTIRAFIRA